MSSVRSSPATTLRLRASPLTHSNVSEDEPPSFLPLTTDDHTLQSITIRTSTQANLSSNHICHVQETKAHPVEVDLTKLSSKPKAQGQRLCVGRTPAFSCFANSNLSFRYAFSDAVRRPRLVGIFTIFLVVFFITFLQNAIQKSPIIFFKLSEDAVGSGDLVLTPISRNGRTALLNSTLIEERLQGESLVQGSSARWFALATALNPDDSSLNASSVLVVLDNDKEKEMGIASRWTHRTLGLNEVHMSSSVLQAIGVDSNMGARLAVAINTTDIIVRLAPALNLTLTNYTMSDFVAALLASQGLDLSRTLFLNGTELLYNMNIVGTIINAAPSANVTVGDVLSWIRVADQGTYDINVDSLVADQSSTRTPPGELSGDGVLADTSTDFLPPPPPLTPQTRFQFHPHRRSYLQALPPLTGPTPELPAGVADGSTSTSTGLTVGDVLVLLGANATVVANDPALLGLLGLNVSSNMTLQNLTRALGVRKVRISQAQLLRALGLNRTDSHSIDTRPFVLDAIRRLGLVSIDPSVTRDIALPLFDSLASFNMEAIAVDGVGDPQAKWNGVLGNVIVMEYKWVRESLKRYVKQALWSAMELYQQSQSESSHSSTAKSAASAAGVAQLPIARAIYSRLVDELDAMDFRQGAMQQIVQYSDRLPTYIKNSDAITHSIAAFTNAVSIRIGINHPAKFDIPIVSALKSSQFLRLFLDQIFSAITAVLLFLGCILIYSLLLGDVEKMTYEYGMLRALGMKQKVLIDVLLLKAMGFAIPGVGLAMIAVLLINIPFTKLLQDLTHYPQTIAIDQSAVIMGVVVGLAMPAIANIGPIRRALSHALRDSLNVYHKSMSEVTVRMTRLADLHISVAQTFAAIILITIGVMVYYLIPYAYSFGDYALFFTVLVLILLGMVVGLSLLCLELQPVAERCATHLLMCFFDRRFRSIVLKNLACHRRRSQKTTLMFTTSIGFIVFAGGMFTLQTASLVSNIKAMYGADIVVVSLGWGDPLNETAIEQYLSKVMSAGPDSVVTSYTYATFPLTDSPQVRDSYIGNLAHGSLTTTNIIGLQSSFLTTTYSEYFLPSEVDPRYTYNSTGSGAPDIVQSLVTQPTMMLEADAHAHAKNDADADAAPVYLGSSIVDSTVVAQQKSNVSRTSAAVYSGAVGSLIMEGLRLDLAIDTTTPIRIQVEPQDARSVITHYLSQPRAMARKLPAYFLSSYRSFKDSSTTFVSEADWFDMLLNIDAQLLARNPTSKLDKPSLMAAYPLSRPPKARLYIRTRPAASSEERNVVVNNLKRMVNAKQGVVSDTLASAESTSGSLSLIMLFLGLVAAVTSALCCLSLFLSFHANVRESVWEYGVLRAIGLTAVEITRVYVWEGLALLLPSICFGSAIGIIMSMTLSLQFSLFTEFTIPFEFPWLLFASVWAMSIAAAVMGSFFATFKFARKEITEVLRAS